MNQYSSQLFFSFYSKEVDKVVGIDPIALERKIAQHSRKQYKCDLKS
jgi:hypothetical protein